jgi:hypothetical protein
MTWIEDDELPACYRVSVAALQKSLSTLRPTDILIPNRVQNLSIVRDGKQIGIVQLRTFSPESEAEIEFWENV